MGGTRSISFKPKKGKGKSVFKPKDDTTKMYDKTWEKYRVIFLSANKKCYCCGEKANVVDHIVAHKGDSKLFTDVTNHLPLCKRDHDVITARFDKHNPPMTEAKMHYISERRAATSTSVSVKVLPRYGNRE